MTNGHMSDEKMDMGALCPACFLSVFHVDRDDIRMTMRGTSEDAGALCRSSVGTFSLAAAGIRLTLSLKAESHARNYGACMAPVLPPSVGYSLASVLCKPTHC